MAQILFKNAKLLDPHADALEGGVSVLVEGETIREISVKSIKAPTADVIDCKGRTLMPGLIDCHVHVMLSEVNIRYLEAIPLTMMTVRAAALMRGMIDRGFTTVRDTGGADWGMRDGVAQGHLPGPRMFIAGRALGPTGGHSDARRRTDVHSGACKCCNAMSFCLEVVDGADAVRAAVREQLRQGVDQIKIMVSGGVASPYDPLDSRQFSLAEIAAAVEEAAAFGRYTQAHAYTPDAITRAVSQGVRTIEHGNLIDEKSAKLMKDKGAYLVANLVAYYAMKERAKEFGMSSEMLAKNDMVIDGGLKSLEICKRRRHQGGIRQRPARSAAGGPEPRVPVAPRGAVADRNHPAGHARGRRDRAHARQARRREAGRVRRHPGRRRRPDQEARIADRPGREPVRHHEGRPLPQEPPGGSDGARGALCAGPGGGSLRDRPRPMSIPASSAASPCSRPRRSDTPSS